MTRPDELERRLKVAHPLQPCWDAQLAGLDADAVDLALELGLFDELAEFVTVAELARRRQLDADSLGYFLDLLHSMALLECGEAGGYRLRAALQPYLLTASERYCGDALRFRLRTLRQIGAQLAARLRGEPPPPVAADRVEQGWAQAARLQIAQEQRALTCEVACALMSGLPEFASARRLLDLGGGPGLVAIALLRQREALHGTLFELPETARVARDNVVAAGLGERLDVLGGDLRRDDFGGDYDLIWCSSVLHFVDDLEAFVERLFQALAPGGVLVCAHAEIAGAGAAAHRVRQYYLHPRMQGRHVLAGGELAGRLRRAGFAEVRQIDEVRFPVAPVSLLLARKA